MTSTHWIIVVSGMQPASSARKLAPFQPPAWKRKCTKGTRNRWTHKADRDDYDDDTHSITSGDITSVHKLFRISQKKTWPSNGIGGHQWQMGRDGNWLRCCSIANQPHHFWQTLSGPNNSKLSLMVQKLVTYTGENLTPCGTSKATITYDNQQYHLPLVVVPGSGPTLLGRNWLEVIQLHWNRIHHLKAVNATQLLRTSYRGTWMFSKMGWVN